MAMAFPVKRRVGLLMVYNHSYGRAVADGFQRFVRQHTRWNIAWAPLGWEMPDSALREKKIDGMICFVRSSAQLRALRHFVPHVVNVSHLGEPRNAVSIHTDDEAVGVLAAEHFLEKGFTRFLYLGLVDHAYSLARHRGFESRIKSEGYSVTYRAFSSERWSWLRELPKPCALFVGADWMAFQALEACAEQGIAVPDDIAVLGVDNDLPHCELTSVPLSSIELAGSLIGARAAASLGQLMEGHAVDTGQPHLIPPVGVVERRSTEGTAVGDAAVAQAVRYIQDQAFEPVTVDAIAHAVRLPRFELEKRFRQVTGRSPYQQVLAIRLRKAQELLMRTNLPISEIAEQSAFHDLPSFSVFFKQRTGFSPGQYRKAYR